ncbi:MAG: DUF192 domain-containing protein [Candidatus Pacebacteria bacterium]|nr:DUF192 domain-containing protein [Candidatus Paceibacterota bacterium]
MSKKYINLKIISLIFLVFILFGFISKYKSDDLVLVCYNDNCFKIELAITIQEQIIGLMYREELPKDSGMLFVYNDNEIRSFWMKNTLIPLDIIWIDENKKIVDIKKDVQPCQTEKCSLITPKNKARYILELNAGISDEIGLIIGNNLIFKNIL